MSQPDHRTFSRSAATSTSVGRAAASFCCKILLFRVVALSLMVTQTVMRNEEKFQVVTIDWRRCRVSMRSAERSAGLALAVVGGWPGGIARKAPYSGSSQINQLGTSSIAKKIAMHVVSSNANLAGQNIFDLIA